MPAGESSTVDDMAIPHASERKPLIRMGARARSDTVTDIGDRRRFAVLAPAQIRHRRVFAIPAHLYP